MTTGALVPALRPSMATSGILSGEPVSARDWSTMGGLANYCNGHGAMLIPWCAIGRTIAKTTSETFHFFVAPKKRAVERIWAVNLRAVTADATASVTCGGASAVTVYPTTSRDGRTSAFVFREQLSAKTNTAADATIAIEANVGNVVVESLAMYEQTRFSLAKDAVDYGVDLGTLRARLPIRDIGNESAAAVADAYDNLDARRAGIFYWSTPTSVAIEITSASDVDLFPLQVPFQAAIRATGTTTSMATVAVYAKVDSGSATVPVTAAGGGSVTLTVSGTSFAWVSDKMSVTSEDLSVADGRRSNTWETLRIKGNAGKATTLSIAAVSVYTTSVPL